MAERLSESVSGHVIALRSPKPACEAQEGVQFEKSIGDGDTVRFKRTEFDELELCGSDKGSANAKHDIPLTSSWHLPASRKARCASSSA